MRRGNAVHHYHFTLWRLSLWTISLLTSLWLCGSPFAASAVADTFWQERQSELVPPQPVPPAFVDLAKALQPAVVNISTKQEEGEQFQEFFERFFEPRNRKRRRPGQGSGFIINAEGYIVTNYHVVENATEIQVTLTTQKQFAAELIGGDEKTDLALLKIEANDLPTVPAGNSDALEVGEWVIAIGNPFGLGHTVTTGIVSAKGRIIGAGPYDDFIQTDASINPGNSGGPLFNMRGEVIGINTAIVPQGQGIGFAIPSNMAKDILRQLRGAGKVTRGWLGVVIQKLSPGLMQAFKLKDDRGALVSDVVPDSPAEKAGLKRGDIIVGFNGSLVEESQELPRLVATMTPETEVTVEVIRDGERQSLPVTLGKMKEDEPSAVAKLEPSDVESTLGLRVQSLTPAIAQQLRLEDTNGVVISAIAQDSPAAEAGLRRGDVIREVNQTPVTNMDDYETATAHLDPKAFVLLRIERRGNSLFITVKPEQAG
ncbi:MAG: DegQ family serine endoprotease [Candidatus Tectomicrobia bacterium]|nr:DegQ family serine endoprotease [Candidatus Tectomicrobia bacterium]